VDEYDSVEKILLEKIPDLLFSVAKYKLYSILSIINNYKRRVDEAKKYAALARAKCKGANFGTEAS
jgi:hypothetical protein